MTLDRLTFTVLQAAIAICGFKQVRLLPEIQAIFLIRDIYLAEKPLKELSASERLSRREQEVKPKVLSLLLIRYNKLRKF